MTANLQLRHTVGQHIEIATPQGAPLWRYVYRPETPPNESPRPYAHPVYSVGGDVLTGFRPDDHPWHHGLSLTLTSVDAVNFWGGPSYRAADGYCWRDDHGRQVHRAWVSLAPERLEEEVEWRAGSAAKLFDEHRVLQTTLADDGWTLRWTSELRNESGRELTLGNYHALGGLAGSHYTGLQFRGAGELVGESAAPAMVIRAEGGLEGESSVHGARGRWMEWSCSHAGTARRTRIRFEDLSGQRWWFVRASAPLAAFAFQREHPQRLPAGATLRLDHALTFATA